jgi:hypothetical protein
VARPDDTPDRRAPVARVARVGRRTREDRFFRDFRGTVAVANTRDGGMLVARQSASVDDVSRRHWAVVCADRCTTSAR